MNHQPRFLPAIIWAVLLLIFCLPACSSDTRSKLDASRAELAAAKVTATYAAAYRAEQQATYTANLAAREHAVSKWHAEEFTRDNQYYLLSLLCFISGTFIMAISGYIIARRIFGIAYAGPLKRKTVKNWEVTNAINAETENYRERMRR